MFSDALLKRPENIQEFASGELDKHYIVLYTDMAEFSMWGAWEKMTRVLWLQNGNLMLRLIILTHRYLNT